MIAKWENKQKQHSTVNVKLHLNNASHTRLVVQGVNIRICHDESIK